MDSLQGHLLLAAPSLIDPNFFRTVVLMVQHNAEGALGLVLNRPTTTMISTAWNQVDESPCLREGVLYHGGPCEGPLMVVHTCPDIGDGPVVPGLYFCTEKSDVEQVIQSGEGDARFFVGYAGWSPGQLEAEMSTGSWLTLPAAAEQVFSEDVHLWEIIHRRITTLQSFPRLDPRLLPKDPRFN